MKRIVFIIALLVVSFGCFAQDVTNSDLRKYSVTQDTKVPFRLFPMQNSWNFIKLDTRTGQLWGVQFTVDSESDSFTYVIEDSPIEEATDENIGRFTLYPTSNMHTFILLDQKDGRSWQVQNYVGGNSRSQRFRKRIW